MSDDLLFNLYVKPLGSDISDDFWAEKSDASIRTWDEASRVLEKRVHQWRGRRYVISTDWRPMIRSVKRYSKVMSQVHHFVNEHRSLPTGYNPRFQRLRTRIPIQVALSSAKRDQGHQSPANLASYVVESHIHDVFLILSISNPGSCDFYRSSLRGSSRNGYRFQTRPTEISLSDFHFDLADLDGRSGEWPAPRVLSLDRVADWIFFHRPGLSQVPTSRIEGVLFALLHLSKEGMSATQIVWIFFALETLLDTQPGQSRRSLIDRIALLLECSAGEKKLLKRRLTSLYEMRSSLVHGGMKVIHPMHNELLDKTVDAEFQNLSGSIEFGVRLLIVVVQTTIDKGWRSLKFREMLEPPGET